MEEEDIPIDELRFRKFEFENQLERQKIFLKYLHYISTPLFIMSLFYSMTFAASLLLIMYALRCFCIFRLERFEHLLYTKQMVIFAFEYQKRNPNLCQQQLEMDPDKYLQSQIKMGREFEEFRKQQQRQTELKEKYQEKTVKSEENPKEKQAKVPFKKNSKANKISRSEKRVRKIVMNAPGLS